MAEAFEKAGGKVETFVFKSLNRDCILESYKELAKKNKRISNYCFPSWCYIGK